MRDERRASNELPLAPMANASNMGLVSRYRGPPDSIGEAWHDEPSNEELGIVPDRRPIVAYLLIAFFLVAYGVWGLLS